MLRELRIRNLAIIDNLTVQFSPGLSVLTGETGAGKSIIIDAVGFALGGRASAEEVRTGEKEASIEAFFEIDSRQVPLLDEMGIDAGEGLIFRRIISSAGKSRAYLNDSLVNLQSLSSVSKAIVDIHGQHEHQSILSPDNQMDLLDAYGGLLSKRQEIDISYKRLQGLRARLSDLLERQRERAQRQDLLRFQIREIEEAGLRSEEENKVEEERNVLANISRLMQCSNDAYDITYGSETSCLSMLKRLQAIMKDITSIDPKASNALKAVEEAIPLVQDAYIFLRGYREDLDYNPKRLEEIEDRIELIKRLKKKYGETIDAILKYLGGAKKELVDIEGSEEEIDSIKAEIEELRKAITEKARSLSSDRKAVASRIDGLVEKGFDELMMGGTRFIVEMSKEKGDDTLDGFMLTPKGMDRIEFLISPNPGEEPRPLSKIASGGELSRIMLILKGILASVDKTPVLIFDEIDAGIGGETATSVGKRLKMLSKGHQVICITHLPQIASFADRHLKIEKAVEDGRTRVSVRAISGDERTREIARMLGGDSRSEVSLRHAEDILRGKAEVR